MTPLAIFARAVVAVATLNTLGCSAIAHDGNSSALAGKSNQCNPHVKSIAVTQFGARGDALSDNLQAFKDAIGYASRCAVPTVTIPAGKYEFTPHGPETGIYLGSNLSLRGEGTGATELIVANGNPDSNFVSLLWARNQDNISIAGITFVGSNVPIHDSSGRPLNYYGSALMIALDADDHSPQLGAPRDLAHFLVRNCSFRNFNAAAWIAVINYNTTFKIDDVRIVGNEFLSYDHNAINPSSIGYVANAISITGSVTSSTGIVRDVLISRNLIHAGYIKGGIAIWSGVRSVLVSDNTIVDAGAAAYIPNDSGAYAITVYNNAYYYHDAGHVDGAPKGGSRPDGVHIEHNTIVHPRSCGVYTASADRVWIRDNSISGQSDPENETLLKGAIAVVNPNYAIVTGNRISSSLIGISLLPGPRGTIRSTNNRITDIPTGGVAIAPVR